MYIHNPHIYFIHIYLYTYMPLSIYIYIFLFLWMCEPCRILAPQPGVEPVVPAMEVCHLKN